MSEPHALPGNSPNGVWIEPGTSGRLRAMGVLGAHIPAVTISTRFWLGLALGALLAGVFPFAYAASIVLVAWAVFLLASTSGAVPGAASDLPSLLEWLGVLLGGLLILSMLKPLVAPRGRTAEPHSLDGGKEVLLFGFVKELASNVGVMAPSQIAVDNNVNSYCVFRGGVKGFSHCGFALVIGLPLAACLRLDQLAGVVAHELGHAALVRTVRSSYFIWAVHAWFSRVVFEQDRMDEQILSGLETPRPGVRLAWRFAQLLVHPGRGVLRLMMMAEGAVSAIFLRRVELEADRYQVRAGGTGAFISATLEINLLTLAAQRSLVELSWMKQRGQLVDDYPGLMASIRGRYSEEFVQRLMASVDAGKTGIFSTHFRDKDRIALARAENSIGIIKADLPASVLFTDFGALCREVTLEFYEEELHVARKEYELVPLQNIKGWD